jgi:hypothetical protein
MVKDATSYTDVNGLGVSAEVLDNVTAIKRASIET